MGLRIRVERSVSRRGLHMRIATYLAIGRGCVRVTPKVVEKIPARPTYVKGEAYELLVEVPQGSYAVQVDMKRNPRRRVRGDLTVYDATGTAVARAVYRKLKIKVLECHADQGLIYEIIRCAANTLGLPVKRYGVPRCEAGGS